MWRSRPLKSQHLMTGPQPTLFDFQGLLQSHARWQHGIHRTVQDIGHHGICVAQPTHDDRVEWWGALEVAVEAGELDVRSGLPLDQSVYGPRPTNSVLNHGCS